MTRFGMFLIVLMSAFIPKFCFAMGEWNFQNKVDETQFILSLNNAFHPHEQKELWKRYSDQNVKQFKEMLTSDGKLTGTAFEYWLFFQGQLIPRSNFNEKGRLIGEINEIKKSRKDAFHSRQMFSISLHGHSGPRYFVKVHEDFMGNSSAEFALKLAGEQAW